MSGAISKDREHAPEATTRRFESIYVEAWKLGLKSIAVYRDGCKRSQPLNTSLDSPKKDDVPAPEPRAVRRRLPDERRAVTHKFSIGGHDGYITVGMYEDGSPGEVFLVMAKEGSIVSGLMDSFATAVSWPLQYGVPLDVLGASSCTRASSLRHDSKPQIPMANAIMDYIFRWLALKSCRRSRRGQFGPPQRRCGRGADARNGHRHDHAGTAMPLVGASATRTATERESRDQRQRLFASGTAVFRAQADATMLECGEIMVRTGLLQVFERGVTSGASDRARRLRWSRLVPPWEQRPECGSWERGHARASNGSSQAKPRAARLASKPAA